MNRTRKRNAVSAASPSDWKRAVLLSSMTLLASSVAHAAQGQPDCSALAKLALPDVTITDAKVVAAGTYQLPKSPLAGLGQLPGMNVAGESKLPKNPAFCRISATMHPSKDSDIKMEVWLPQQHWNGKLLAIGNFGWGGSLMEPGMLTGLAHGYATISNNTGHDTDGGQFTYQHPEKLIDYGYRADHLMTVHAKTIVNAFYKKDPSHAYWIGCSLGGLEGLIEAKRYPSDYDGMVIGAPPNSLIGFNAAQLWPSWLVQKNPASAIPEAKFKMIQKAVLKSCATPIGQKQGFVDKPEQCTFQPEQLQCKAGDQADCLTSAQVQLMKQIYQGPVNPRTKQVIFPGPARGSEEQLAGFANGKPFGNALDLFQYAAFQDPKWDWTTMDWDKDITRANTAVGDLFSVQAADLKGYFQNGGKMVFYIGWNDYHNPDELIQYYQTLTQHIGPKSSQVRLFTIPGMGHCFGGSGCDTFNKLGVIDQWVAKDKAPQRIEAKNISREGQTVRSRPLCAYPQTSVYRGHGDINKATSYVCQKPATKL